MAYDAHGFRARAVHTDRPTLATAAYMDWSAELRRLHELRHGREVLLHWCHALEIQHLPPHFDRMPELPGVLPPVRVAACVAANCARCEAGRGGFQFPWIGTFTRRDVLVEAGIPPQVPGQAAHYGFGWALSRQASRTSILLAQPVDSPLCSCATYATASCALIAPGRAELAALSRLALALLGAGLVLPSGTSVQTMDKDGLESGPQALGGEGPQAVSVRVAHWRAAHGVRLWTRTLPLLSAGRGGQPGVGPRSRVGWAAGQPSFSPSSAQAV